MLKYEGVFRDGVFVPDHPLPWKDGTRVVVEVIEDACEGIHVPTFADSHAEFKGGLPPDPPSDLAPQHDQYRLGTTKR